MPYNPWQEKQDIVVFPGAIGGGNWQGVMFNKPLGLMITNVMNAGQWGHWKSARPARDAGPRRPWRRAAAGGDAGRRGARSWRSRRGSPPENVRRRQRRAEHGQGHAGRRPVLGCRRKRYSCAAPPWGELIAVNANTGDIAWRVPLGEFAELEAKGIKTGQPSLGGGITTAGNLVFIGATIDGIFRAFDAQERQGAVAREARRARAFDSVDLHRQGRQAIRGRARGRRRIPAKSQRPTRSLPIALQISENH